MSGWVSLDPLRVASCTGRDLRDNIFYTRCHTIHRDRIDSDRASYILANAHAHAADQPAGAIVPLFVETPIPLLGAVKSYVA